MHRRGFLLLLGGTAGGSPRNELCNSANEFHAQYTIWADRMNASRGAGTLPADAIAAFHPLPNLWRKVERCFRDWVRS